MGKLAEQDVFLYIFQRLSGSGNMILASAVPAIVQLSPLRLHPHPTFIPLTLRNFYSTIHGCHALVYHLHVYAPVLHVLLYGDHRL